jgi:hypothetical protein
LLFRSFGIISDEPTGIVQVLRPLFAEFLDAASGNPSKKTFGLGGSYFQDTSESTLLLNAEKEGKATLEKDFY